MKAEYIDLSHRHDDRMPTDGLPGRNLKFFSRIGEAESLYNLEWLSYCPHVGTHMDAPSHVCSSWKSIEEVDPLILIGPACCISIEIPRPDYAITKTDIQRWEKQNGEIRKGEAVCLYTGHAAKWGQGKDAFIDPGYPYLAVEAAAYLAAKQIRWVGTESISIDKEGKASHQILLGNQIAVVENLCNLEKVLPYTRFETIGTFPAVEGASGVWIRLLAKVYSGEN